MAFEIPAWLDMPPDEVSEKPPVTSRVQSLPFRELTWRNFERLVLRLVRRQENVRQCALYGTAGQRQEGLDILAVGTKSEEHTCYQCKNVASFGEADIRDAVAKFLEGKWANNANTFVLCVAIPLQSTQQVDAIVEQGARLERKGIQFVIWDGSEGGVLSETLKRLPELVDDFFGRGWVSAFNGNEAADGLGERLDGQELARLRQRLGGLYETVFNRHDPGLRLPGLHRLRYVNRYVPVDLTEQTLLRIVGQPEPTAADGSLRADPRDPAQPEWSQSTAPRSWLDVLETRRPTLEWLSDKQQCVVLGEPGSGKSALLRYLALALLGTEAPEIAELDVNLLNRLPVWMSFARYTAILKEQPNANVEDYVRGWLHQHSFDDIYPLFERALRHSNVLLLVDGLDEGASQSHRQEALDRILAFVLSTGAAVICTSRPRGFRQMSLPDAWNTGAIAAMNDDQVRALASRWFSVAELSDLAGSTDTVTEKQAEDRASLFLSAVKEHVRTDELSRNPLLCQAMIEIYRFSHRLPEARVNIYDKIIELLLSQHPAARAHAAYAETPAKLLGIQEHDLREILIRLAVDLQHNVTGELRNITHCRGVCAEFLRDGTYGLGRKHAEAERLARDTIGHLISQYGLLVERSPGEIGFVHLSIQEYLTAESISRKEESVQLEWLDSVWGAPEWRECVTSWFGIHGARGNKGLTGGAADRLRELGSAGEWQQLQSLELRTELACTDLGIPIGQSRKIVEEATRSVETSPFSPHRKALARSITLGAIGSGVSEECAAALQGWIPGRPSFSRARLLECFKSWQPANDLRKILLRGLYDEQPHCRVAALDSLISVFETSPGLEEALTGMAIHDPRPEFRATGLRGLGKRREWADAAGSAAVANLRSCSTVLLSIVCEARVRLGCHNDDDLQRMWHIWSTSAVDYWNVDEFTDALCTGWPRHQGLRNSFTAALKESVALAGLEIPLLYLIRNYPGDDEIASAIANYFNQHEFHIPLNSGRIWRSLVAHFRGHPLLGPALRRSLHAYKERHEATYWHPHTTPALIVIGDDAARDELLEAYLSVEPDMSRYWIAKTLIDGWPGEQRVTSTLLQWASQDVDAAAPLASWAAELYPHPGERRVWLTGLVETASPRIVTNAMQALLDEFPDEESCKLVEMRANGADIWYYHRMRVQGALARHFPANSSSVELVQRSLQEIDGPQIADFAGSYENHVMLRPKIMASAIAAPEDVRMTIAATLRGQPIDAEAMQFLTPDVLAEESGSVRSATLIARARTTKGHEKKVQVLSDLLIEELGSRGTYHEMRKRSALAALLELGHAERAVSTMADAGDLKWHYYLPDSLNRDTTSLGIIIDKWHELKPWLSSRNLEDSLPMEDIIGRGYGSLLDNTTLPRRELEEYLKHPWSGGDPTNYFVDIARRFPKTVFLRDQLLEGFDEQKQIYSLSYRTKFVAARLLSVHFSSDADVASELSSKIESTRHSYLAISAGVLAILSLGWPESTFGERLQEVTDVDKERWLNCDRLLAAVALGDAETAEQVAVAMVQEPSEMWRHRTEDGEALQLWAEQPMAVPVLQKWSHSDSGSLAISSLALLGVEGVRKAFVGTELVEKFNREMAKNSSVPVDGLDAVTDSVTSWANCALTIIQESNKY